jgi:alpha-L-arabinofuranosidase
MELQLSNSGQNKRRILLCLLCVFLLVFTGVNSYAQKIVGDISVTVHIDKPGAPISPLMYGMFTELLFNMYENGIWSEMLSDRKFFYPVNNSPELVPKNTKGHQNRWRPVGPEKNIVMDSVKVYLGKHSPKVILDGTSSGIKQAGIWLREGSGYTGRIVLCGDPGVEVEVSLVWGPGANERQKIVIDRLTADYRKYPLDFTANGNTNNGYIEILGLGKGSFHIGAVSIMPSVNIFGFRRDLIDILKQMNSGIYRWPGGNFLAGYEWRYGIGDPDKRPPRYDYAWNTVESNDVGTDEFITMCRLINVEPYIVVNSGFGDAHSAAEWVEYVNGSKDSPNGMLRAADGHPEPYGVKYWGIGNEMYGEWQLGHMSVEQYSLKHNLFAEAMLEKDPTIKITGCGASILEASTTARHHRPPLHAALQYGFLTPDDWSGNLLKGSFQNMDYLSEHAYSVFDAYFDKESQKWVKKNDSLSERVRRTPSRIKGMVECLQEYEKRIPGLKERHITMWLDEWIAGGPLGIAVSLHELFRNSYYVSMAGFTGFNALYRADDVSASISPVGLLFKMYRDHLGTIPVEASGNSPQKPLDGTVWVDLPAEPSGSQTYPLDVFAAVNETKSKLTVAIVNPTYAEQELKMNFKGETVAGDAKVWVLVPPPGDPYNQPVGQPVASVRESNTKLKSSVRVEPASITLYEINLK